MIDFDDDLVELICSKDNAFRSFKQAYRGKNIVKSESQRFKQHLFCELDSILNQLYNAKYVPLSYNRFKVYIPKEREIHSPKFRDKVAQHMLNNVLREIYERKFIYDSYACIRGKGNHAAVKRLYHFCKSSNQVYANPIVVKIDMSKFFYTIDRSVLIDIILKDFGEHNPKIAIYLIEIIKSSPANTTVENGDTLGLPLGNLTSQLLANVLMNKVDQYAKNHLKIKYYMRYADDIFIIVNGKDEAKRIEKGITAFIETNLKLTVNPKKSGYYPLFQGIDGLGFSTSHKGIRITQRTKQSIRKLISDINRDYQKNTIDYIFRERQLNSYKSFISVCNNTGYMDNIIESNPILRIDTNGNYKVERKYNKNGKMIIRNSAYIGEIDMTRPENNDLFLYG